MAPKVISTDDYLRLAVFRMSDLCVAVQEDMEAYLSTAALQKMPGAEATFSWLRRRGVRICLLSDYDREQTLLLLRRLQWTVDEKGTVQEVITRQCQRPNPVRTAQEHAGLPSGRYSFTVSDTPRLLQLASDAGVHFNLGVCNGRSAYHQLAVVPHHALLDSLLQLPAFLLEHLPDTRGKQHAAPTNAPPLLGQHLLPRLRLPLSLPWG